MKKNRGAPGCSEVLIINLPVLFFSLLIPGGILLFLATDAPARFLGAVFAVWGVSGGLLMLTDYTGRKKLIYMRLLHLAEERKTIPLDEYLRSTFCGLCIVWALKVRLWKWKKEIGNERKI